MRMKRKDGACEWELWQSAAEHQHGVEGAAEGGGGRGCGVGLSGGATTVRQGACEGRGFLRGMIRGL